MAQSFRAGLFIWGGWVGLFLLYELPAHFGWVPWPTLSSTSWDAEADWHPAKLVFAMFLGVLLAHICFRLSVAALITVVVLAGVALTVHLLTGAL